MLIEIAPEIYQDKHVHKKGVKFLYVQVLKAIYGMLVSALLFYKKLCKDLVKIRFKINLYDPCVANRMVKGHQHTITWHVDNLKSSHMNPKVNEKFIQWLENMYGDKEIGKVKATRGKGYNYLAMNES